MKEAYSLVWSVLVLWFRSRVSLEAEILILRHQLNIQRQHVGVAFLQWAAIKSAYPGQVKPRAVHRLRSQRLWMAER